MTIQIYQQCSNHQSGRKEHALLLVSVSEWQMSRDYARVFLCKSVYKSLAVSWPWKQNRVCTALSERAAVALPHVSIDGKFSSIIVLGG